MAAVVGLEDIKRARTVIDGVDRADARALGRRDLALDGHARAAQGREPAAHGRVQAARRGQPHVDAERRRARARRRRRERRQPRPGRRARGDRARRLLARLHARRRPARQAGRDGRLRRRGRARGRDVRGELRGGALRPEGRVLVPPFDDPAIIAGQGTIGLELLEQAPDADTVVVPLGGGGLLSGIAIAIKALRPDIRVIGVQAAGCASWTPSLAAGRPGRHRARHDRRRRHRGAAPRRHHVPARPAVRRRRRRGDRGRDLPRRRGAAGALEADGRGRRRGRAGGAPGRQGEREARPCACSRAAISTPACCR